MSQSHEFAKMLSDRQEFILPFTVCFKDYDGKFSQLTLPSLTNVFQNGNVLSGTDREI